MTTGSASTKCHSFLPPLIISILVFAGAFMPMPYGYYLVTRVVICVIGIYGAVTFMDKHHGIFWLMVGVGVLYNPIIPVHLYEKGIWILVNIVTVGIFLWAKIELDKHYKEADC